jgi:uncharacterized membrane protein
VAATLACATVAAFLGQPVWAAAAGAGLVLVFWALEALAWRSAARGSFNHAVLAAVGGAAVRMGLVLVCLVLIGVLARPAFPTAALSFLASFTLYAVVRLFSYPFASDSTEGAKAS